MNGGVQIRRAGDKSNQQTSNFGPKMMEKAAENTGKQLGKLINFNNNPQEKLLKLNGEDGIVNKLFGESTTVFFKTFKERYSIL